MLTKVEGVEAVTVTHATSSAEIVCREDVDPEDLAAAVKGPQFAATVRN